MPKFRYQAADAAGKTIFGELDARDVESVLRELAEQGLTAEPGDVYDVAAQQPAGGRLSGNQADEVATRLAELVQAGLPLAPGLRALAKEMPARNVAGVLVEIADALDEGKPLGNVIAAQGSRFPRHLRGLILAGTDTGQLPETLEHYVAFQQSRSQLRHRIWSSLAYPALLLALLLLLFLLFSAYVVPGFVEIYREFGMELPAATRVLVAMSWPGGQALVCVPAFAFYVFLLLATTRVPVWGRRLLYAIPLIGPLWKLSGIAAFSRLLALFLDRDVPLPDALRYTADGLGEPDLAIAGLGAARHVRDGHSLAEAFSGAGQFPHTFLVFADWGQQNRCLPDALRAAAELFEQRLHVQIRLCDNVLPAIMFILVTALAALLVAALMMPLISLISKLAGF